MDSLVAVLRIVLLVPLSSGFALTGPHPITAQAAAANWSVVDAGGPAARWDHTLAADPYAGRLILFGGRDGDSVPFGDTWIYTPAENVWTPVAGPAPSPRFGHVVAVDAANRALYLIWNWGRHDQTVSCRQTDLLLVARLVEPSRLL